LGWADPQPSDAELSSIYGPRYYEAFGFREGCQPAYRVGRRRWFHELLARVGRTPDGGRLLDVGSGVGDLVAAARERGWDAYGIDVNPAALAAAESTAAGRTILGDAEDLLTTVEPVDLITCTDVLEHLRAPADALDSFYRAMRPGGRLLVTTIDANSLVARLMGPHWYHIHPDHLWYLNAAVLRGLAERAGFEVECCGPLRKLFSAGYVLEVLAHGTCGPTRAVARTVLAALPQGCRRWVFHAREGLLLIARRDGAGDGA
jgi:SAM-dependent methyltransferase